MDLDPEGRRLPIKVNSASNGEYLPRPLTPVERAANVHAQALVDRAAKKTGSTRRRFLKSFAGAAATLLAFNEVHVRAGTTGGFFALSENAALDNALAKSELGGELNAPVPISGHTSTGSSITRDAEPPCRLAFTIYTRKKVVDLILDRGV
jgi:hypothetical protein